MSTRTTRAIVLSLGFGLLACAPEVVKLDQATRDSLKRTGEIRVVHYFPPEVQFQGAARAGYGVSAGTAMAMQTQAEGQLASELILEDPILRIKSNVMTSLSKLLSTNNLTPLPTPMQDLQVNRLKTVFGAGTVLDFATTYWGIAPLPYTPHDLVLYRARARLLRFPEGSLLWQGLCDLEAEDSLGMPAESNVPITKAMLLNNTLTRLADRCSEQLVAQFSGASTVN